MNNLSNDRLKALASGDAWACIQDDEGQIMARELLALREAGKEPVAVVELSDYISVAEALGEVPRRKAVNELYDGALVVGQQLYAAPQLPAVPDGWVMVPVEPTYEMSVEIGLPWESPPFPARYHRMIAAAPKPEIPDVEKMRFSDAAELRLRRRHSETPSVDKKPEVK